MSDWKKISPLWGLSDTFTVHEAAALIAGFDPNAVDPSGKYFRNIETNLTDSNGIAEVATVLAALAKAIAAPRPKLRAHLRHDTEPRHVAGIDNLVERGFWQGEDVCEVKDLDGAAYVVALPDLRKTTIDREDLIAWLQARGYTAGFFFPELGQNITDPADLTGTISGPLSREPLSNRNTEEIGRRGPATPFLFGPDWQTRPMKKFVRRTDVILFVEIFRQIQAETGGTLREVVQMVQECLQPVEYDVQFWRLPLPEGVPYESEIAKGGVMCEFFHSRWWDPSQVDRSEVPDPEMRICPSEGGITQEMGMLSLTLSI